jgi:N-acyl-D-aspartate/D-glutamate deacylase
MPDFDLVIRGGLVIDGSGRSGFEADVGVKDGLIEMIGSIAGSGREELDARGRLVTPGFVDIHTHYDGQVTWEETLAPSSSHGVTTVVMGNCGVGFAPCSPANRDALMRLMEGVEDLPEPVLAAGVPWTWESFGEYLSFLEGRAYDIDIATQAPHAAVRLHVMGERALEREPATAEDCAAMASIVTEAIQAGALGFSTSRSLNHRASDGRLTPSFGAAEVELSAIARAVGAAGGGVLQAISDFADEDAEMAMLGRVCRAGGRPMSISILQRHRTPDQWRRLMDWISELNAQGMEVRGQVSCRHLGGLMGLELTSNPLMASKTYQAIADLPLANRIERLRRNDLRAQILAELEQIAESPDAPLSLQFAGVYSLDAAPHGEPGPELFINALAASQGLSPLALVYDLLLAREGRGLLARPSSNYVSGSLDVCGEMMRHPHSVMGLSDGGAHVGLLCDAGQPTHLLSYWGRDRKRGRISIEAAVSALSRETAEAVGLHDRGVIRPGLRADLNVINLDKLQLQLPYVTHDLPAGGRRIRQEAVGYDATIVAGAAIARDGVATGARPGRLVRRPRRRRGP